MEKAIMRKFKKHCPFSGEEQLIKAVYVPISSDNGGLLFYKFTKMECDNKNCTSTPCVLHDTIPDRLNLE